MAIRSLTGIFALVIVVVPSNTSLSQEQAEAGVAQSGYYTQTQDPTKLAGQPVADVLCQVPSPDPRTCLNPALLAGSAPGWPRQNNYLYVARVAADDNSYGYAMPDLLAIPLDSTILAMEVQFQIERHADVGTLNPDFDPDNPHVKLCFVTEDWVGIESGAWDDKPAHDCGTEVSPEKVGEETREEIDPATGEDRERDIVIYRADLMPIAARWAGGEPPHGVAFVPTSDASDSYQIAIRTNTQAPDALVTLITYEPPPLEDFSFPPMSSLDDPGFETFTESFGGGVGGVVPEAPAPQFRVPEEAQTPAGVRRAVGTPDPRTPWWVWTAIPLGMGTVLALGRGLNTTVPAAETGRVGPVGRLMERRKIGIDV